MTSDAVLEARRSDAEAVTEAPTAPARRPASLPLPPEGVIKIIHYVRVAVALSRPPKIDEWRRYCVVAATRHEAELIAQQIAACTSVMPVESHWESSHRAGPVQPFGALGCMCWLVEWSDDIGDGDDGWQIDGRCPYHAEDTAAWVAADGSYLSVAVHGEPSDECRAGTCDCGPATHGSFGDPPTPETANAGGPDTDDTPVIAVCTVMGHSCAAPGAGPCNGWPRTKTYDYATGGIVTDERFKMIGEHGPELPWRGPRKITLKVCPCGDISHAPDECRAGTCDCAGPPVLPELAVKEAEMRAMADALTTEGTEWPVALDVPHICETSRCWQECRNRTEAAKPSTGDTGVLNCTVCDDWSHALGYTTEDSTKAFLALHAHRNAITESGLTECRSLSQARRTTFRTRLFSWLKRH